MANEDELKYGKFLSGEKVGEYTLIDKLGSGKFSTVFSAEKNGAKFAIKIYRCDEQDKYYKNEIKMLTMVDKNMPNEECNIVKYYGAFAHVKIVPTDEKNEYCEPFVHPCVTLQLCGDHVGRLIRFHREELSEGLPPEFVQMVAKDAFRGLAFLHKMGIVHTDIKPENLILDRTVAEACTDGEFNVRIGDLGSSTAPDDIFSYHVGTDCYVAPEIVLEVPYSYSADIWSMFCVYFELITGELLFDVFGECNLTYGDESIDKHVLDSFDSSRDSDSGANYKYLLLIEKILGSPPKEFWSEGRKYYNAKGKLMYNPVIVQKPLLAHLMDNFQLDQQTCETLAEFMLQGLKYIPEERCTAEQALNILQSKNLY